MNDTTLIATIERAEGQSPINLETGEFPMTLATQGEAADGNILNIAGASAPPSIPLQVDHSNSALGTLGTISKIRASRRGSMPVLKAVGRIELDGEGEQADIRRDVALMISKGHLSSVSVRARADKLVPRTDLPVGHFAHVSNGEKNQAKRFGFLFERFTIDEGSIVALGADKRAIIGRSLDAPVSEFWTEFLDDVGVETPDEDERTDEPIQLRPIQAKLTLDTSEFRKDLEAARSTLTTTKPYDFAQVTDVRSLERLLRDVGASRSESKRIIALTKGDSLRDVERNPVAPTKTLSVREVQTMLTDELSGLKLEIFRECSQLLRETLGKVE